MTKEEATRQYGGKWRLCDETVAYDGELFVNKVEEYHVYGNIGSGNNIYSFPHFCMFLLKKYIHRMDESDGFSRLTAQAAAE